MEISRLFTPIARKVRRSSSIVPDRFTTRPTRTFLPKARSTSVWHSVARAVSEEKDTGSGPWGSIRQMLSEGVEKAERAKEAERERKAETARKKQEAEIAAAVAAERKRQEAKIAQLKATMQTTATQELAEYARTHGVVAPQGAQTMLPASAKNEKTAPALLPEAPAKTAGASGGPNWLIYAGLAAGAAWLMFGNKTN